MKKLSMLLAAAVTAFSFASCNKIFIWFDDSRADTPNLTITYNGTKWEAGSLASGVVLDEEKGGSFKYIYLSNNTWFTSTPTGLNTPLTPPRTASTPSAVC